MSAACSFSWTHYPQPLHHHLLCLLPSACCTGCIPDYISTYAGYGQQAFVGDNAPAATAGLLYPTGLTLYNGSLYIADSGQHRVRKVALAEGNVPIITTVAGTGTAGGTGDGGPAVAAALNTPTSVAFDSVGNMVITEALANRIRMVTPSGIISTIAGTGVAGFGGDGGPAGAALLKNPVNAVFDVMGNLFIADFGNFRIRRLDAGTGHITTVAGVGTPGYSGDGGAAISAELNNPSSLVFDKAGNLLFADSLSHAIRMINASTGIIDTVAGTGKFGYSGDGGPARAARLWSPMAIALDSYGDLFISDSYNNRIRRVAADTGVIETIAGTASGGYSGDDGPAMDALMSNPQGIAVDSDGGVFFADYNNHKVRLLTCTQ